MTPGRVGRLSRAVAVALFGPRPAVVFVLLAPTLAAIALDVVVRRRAMRDFTPIDWFHYTGSALAGAGIWAAILWSLAALWSVGGPRRAAARTAFALFSLLFVTPLAIFAYGVQTYYFEIFDAYLGRDTLRLGLDLRGTVGAWLSAWGSQLAPAALAGLALAAAIACLAARAAPTLRRGERLVPIIVAPLCLVTFWFDLLSTNGLQQAPPDVCFFHSVVGLVHDNLVHRIVVRGVSLRPTMTMPALTPPAYRPNVILVITESVRADALCSAPGAGCSARFLDLAAPDRLGLREATAQSSGTFTSCMTLWTGLAPDADFDTAHTTPMVWEIARALGYKTAYVTSQNLRYRDLSAYVKNAGIDVSVGSEAFGDASDLHLGAPDERATARALAFARDQREPYFAVVHLSNTHWPYRVDPALQPNAPHEESPSKASTEALHNHYRNAVLFQERTVADYLAALRALPSWPDTLVVFASDHGEAFREHGALYHLKSLFDEEVRIPAFVVGGDRALGPERRAALTAYRDLRVFGQDLHATVVDALGAFEQQASFAHADRLTGRSLLRPRPADEPVFVMATSSGVWESENPSFGAMQGERKVIGREAVPWVCYDLGRDPNERHPFLGGGCPRPFAVASRAFPLVPRSD